MSRKQSSQWEFGNLFDTESVTEPVGTKKVTIAKKPLKPPKPQVMTVGDLTRKIRDLLEGGFRSINVSGEISNFRAQSSGHCYFTLKDGDAQLSCVLFRGERVSHREQLEQGVKLVLKGDISVYMPRGQYQMVVRGIELEGVGVLQLAFEKLKKKLKDEGLFDADRKRVIPLYPKQIGIVTSPTGAAIRDVAHVLGRRHPGLKLVVAGCRVQGQGAAEEIAMAIAMLNKWHAGDPESRHLDMILITRGGGSLEDLWAFNEEVVARAVANSELPVISAVGHEIDFTISDFVADARAATPSAAAELMSEGVMSVRYFLDQAQERMASSLESFLEQSGMHLGQVGRRLDYLHPRRVLERHTQRLDDLHESLFRATRHQLHRLKERFQQSEGLMRTLHPERQFQEQARQFMRLQRQFSGLVNTVVKRHYVRHEQIAAQLKLLGPVQVLARGYSITQHAETGEVIKSASELKENDTIRTHVIDGDFLSQIQA
ncbi:MAG: exodeoxyribonuclease VII large subunit [Verrucomicrobia bacterium]|jgi:exodeoxyribonuclease VII large subunit|nr:exodeoxyribonuclease VII large subunit [Verrucomicrobiota bacterium]